MRPRRWQKGEGKAGCIFWALLVGGAALVAARWVPAKIADSYLKDYVEELAQLYPRKDARWFETSILNRAKDRDIPLKKKELQVDKSARRVRVKLKYTVTLDFIIYQYDQVFEHDIERDIFLVGSLPRAPDKDPALAALPVAA